MKRVIGRARVLTKKKLLLRLDSAHDAIDTRVLLRNEKKVSYIVKWNPRRENTSELCEKAFAEGKVTEPRDGKRVALLTVRKRQVHEKKTYIFTKVARVTERTVNKHGQRLLITDCFRILLPYSVIHIYPGGEIRRILILSHPLVPREKEARQKIAKRDYRDLVALRQCVG